MRFFSKRRVKALPAYGTVGRSSFDWPRGRVCQLCLVAFDLSDRPRRSAMRLIAWGDRPSCFAASSSDVEDLASSINRRSSLNDQGLRAISETILSQIQDKAAKRTHVARRLCLGGAGPWGSPVLRWISDCGKLATKTAD